MPDGRKAANSWEASAAERDRELERRRQEGERISFGEFYSEEVLRGIEGGAAHPTLGANLKGADWKKAGLRKIRHYIELSGLPVPEGRVVDYGCGSLRLGHHFIRRLRPGGYLGLDVVPGFYEMGLSMLGEEIVARKRPALGVIGDAAIEDRAAALGADLVIASAVAFHVHPDELETFGANLRRFVAKPGCVLLFDAVIADEPSRYAHRGWARPVGAYESLLAPLTLTARHDAKPYDRDERPMTMELLEFRA